MKTCQKCFIRDVKIEKVNILNKNFFNRNNFVKEKKHAQDVDKKCIEMELIALSSEFL